MRRKVQIIECIQVKIKDDPQLVKEFLKFQLQNKVYGPRSGSYVGLGCLTDYFFLEQKKIIKNFFKNKKKKIYTDERKY